MYPPIIESVPIEFRFRATIIPIGQHLTMLLAYQEKRERPHLQAKDGRLVGGCNAPSQLSQIFQVQNDLFRKIIPYNEVKIKFLLNRTYA